MRYLIPIVAVISGLGLILLIAVSRGASAIAIVLGAGVLISAIIVAWLAAQVIRPPKQVTKQRLATITFVTGVTHFVASGVLAAMIFAEVEAKREPRLLVKVASVLFFPMSWVSLWATETPLWVLFIVNAILWAIALAAIVWLRGALRPKAETAESSGATTNQDMSRTINPT